MDPSQKRDTIVNFIDQSKIIPEDVNGLIRTTTRHGTADQKAWAADLISKIEDRAPEAMNDFTAEDVTYSKSMANMLRYGLSPQEAVERLKDEFDPRKEDVIKLRKQAFKDVIKNQNIRADIRAAIGSNGWFDSVDFPNNKNITDAMTADYRNIYEQEYIRCGDPVIAKESANTLIKKTYGVSKINGRKEIMPFAPEQYYSLPNTDNEWMRKQLIDTVKSLDNYKQIEDKNIGIVADSLTALDIKSKQRPTYKITVRTDQGYEILRDKNGNILQMQFNPEAELEKINALIEKQKREKISVAKTERDIARSSFDYYRTNTPSEINEINKTLGLDS
jgi:hypothetical protein